MIPEDSRFHDHPDDAFHTDPRLPEGYSIGVPDPDHVHDVAELTALLQSHENAARGWASASGDDILVEISADGTRMRANLIIRDRVKGVRAWASVHDRANGRMVYIHCVSREIPSADADACSRVMFDWAHAQARNVGKARSLVEQQIDTGAFENDERQQAWLREEGFSHVRTWWQMSRPVTPGEGRTVASPTRWEANGVTFRLVEHAGGELPVEEDLHKTHDVLEGAFTDHFNSKRESFGEFLTRLRESPGHRWDHWWLAEVNDEHGNPYPVGALVGAVSESEGGPNGSYVDYIGVLKTARGRGVAKGLLNTIIADAALRNRNRVGLEVDADSPTGADAIYTSMGWRTSYVTQSWHKFVEV